MRTPIVGVGLRHGTCGLLRQTLVALVVSVVFPLRSSAVLVNLTDDAYVSSGALNSNFGASGSLNVSSAGSTTLLKFDLSLLPAGGASNNVVKATLTVFIGKITTGGQVGVRRVTTGPWDEAHVTAATAPSIGDLEDSVPDITDRKSFLAFNVTALVKDWVANVLPNNGMALVSGSNPVAITFNSKENTATAHPATLDVTLSTPCAGNDAQDTMVKVGFACVDVYEASVWSTPTGGAQYGMSSPDYPCNADGSNCTNIYARSVAGVVPSTSITWLQAQQACGNSGKRLLSSAEWQMAASGTPGSSSTDNGTTDCNTTSTTYALPEDPVTTGSRSNCVSVWGVFDMVGNVREFAGEPLPQGVQLKAASRGGDFTSGAAASVLEFDTDALLDSQGVWGFRCGR